LNAITIGPPSPVNHALIMSKVALRSWWWEHYHDHPSFQSGQGGTEGFAGAVSSGKHKIYCKKCLDSHVANLRAADDTAVTLGHRAIARSQDQVESHCTF
jgi:hypothetical protein